MRPDVLRRRNLCRALALLLPLLLPEACKRNEAEAGEGDSAAATATVRARTSKVTVQPFSHAITAIGTVVARPGRSAALSAPSPTRVSQVLIVAGQRVVAGQPLIVLDQSTFAASTGAAGTALVAAQQNAARANRLANEGIVPRKDAEQANAELARARSDLVTAQRAERLATLRSPVSGVVIRLAAVLGQPADAGQVLVEVADPSAFDVVLSLGPGDAGQVHTGAAATLSAGERAGGEALGSGVVSAVSAAVDTISRAVEIRVNLATPRRPLRLGESVYGQITVSVVQNAVVVPAAALVPGDESGTYKVFVVDAKGVAHATDVKVGDRTESLVQITDGLQGGETVVTQGAYGIEDSAKVAVPVPVKS